MSRAYPPDIVYTCKQGTSVATLLMMSVFRFSATSMPWYAQKRVSCACRNFYIPLNAGLHAGICCLTSKARCMLAMTDRLSSRPCRIKDTHPCIYSRPRSPIICALAHYRLSCLLKKDSIMSNVAVIGLDWSSNSS